MEFHSKENAYSGEISNLYDRRKTGSYAVFKAISRLLLRSATLYLYSTFLPSQPPSEEKINGILLGFRIRYRELLYDRLRSYSLHNINSLTTWGELTGEELLVFYSLHCWFHAHYTYS